MEALQATSNALKDCPLARGDDAKAFAGPQCFPQLQDEARLHANMPAPAAGADTAVPPPSAAREQMQDGWMRCDRCMKWRLVDLDSLPALREDEYGVHLSRGEHDWGAWLDGAGRRWQTFLRTREEREGAEAGAPESERHAAAEVSEPGGTERASTDCGSGAELEEGLRRELDAGLARLRSAGRRGGGLVRLGLEALEQQEVETPGPELPVLRASRTRPLFLCSMLVTRAETVPGGRGREWRVMSCEDPDDFETLRDSRWEQQDFEERDPVCFWASGVADPP